MLPAPIEEYRRPADIEAVLAAIASGDEDIMLLAGGQSAMQAIKSRMVRPRVVVDLQQVEELKAVDASNGELRIGALVRYVDIASRQDLSPALQALSDAASRVGDRQVRNRGTIGGSLCWNYVAACMPTVTLALDGQIALASAVRGRRVLEAGAFLLSALTTARQPDELLESITFAIPQGRVGSAYRKWSLVTDGLPVVAVAAQVTLDGQGRCAKARVAFGGLADGSQRAPAAENLLEGSDLSAEAVSRALGAGADPLDLGSDDVADAEYRRRLILSIGADVVGKAAARARSAQQ